VALVRLDNQGILEDGQTAICTAREPFTTWECGRRIEQRLDGPTWAVRRKNGRVRNFVFARKHLPCTRKRTAIYELRGDLSDANAPIEVCEIQELSSSGDTAYTSLAPLSRNRSLLAWYSSPVDQDLPWFEASRRRATSGSPTSTSGARRRPACIPFRRRAARSRRSPPPPARST
jgi:hypothetical protein